MLCTNTFALVAFFFGCCQAFPFPQSLNIQRTVSAMLNPWIPRLLFASRFQKMLITRNPIACMGERLHHSAFGFAKDRRKKPV